MDIKESDIFSQSAQVRHPWEIARAALVERLLIPVLKQLGPGSVVLDFGCGDAFILKRLARKWPLLRFVGIDSALTAARIEQLAQGEQKNVEFHADPAGAVPAQGVAMVLLLDVLEHVQDDMTLLSHVASFAGQKGFLLVTAPSYQRLYNNHDRWLGHYRRYALKSLEERLGQLGLRPVFSGRVFSLLVLPRMLSKTAECLHLTHRRPHEGIGSWKYGRATGWLLSKILYFNSWVDILLSRTGIQQAGLSILILCQK